MDPSVMPEFDGASSDGEVPSAPSQKLIELGPPPSDASGIQKWSYQALSIMAYEALVDPNISAGTRMKRVGALLAAARGHYPEAAKFDLAEQIRRDADARNEKKRARAAAKSEPAPAIDMSKVIPIRRDA